MSGAAIPLSAHIVVVEDDPEIRRMVAALLAADGHAVREAPDAATLDRLLAETPADLLILDHMMPGEDGLSVCRRLSGGAMAIIMVTARASDIDRIVGLELGADDYLPKPFNPRELTARVRAVLRRRTAHAGQATPSEAAAVGPWIIDFAARSLRDAATGTPVPLSSGEWDLMAVFVRNPGRVMDRDRLLDATRGRMASPLDRAIDVQVSKLRRKLGDDPADPQAIKTVRGGGYMLALPVRRLP
jgi:two-component system OmpR family response regulator